MDELKKAAAAAEAKGDWRDSIALKTQWLLGMETDADGHTPAEREAHRVAVEAVRVPGAELFTLKES
jgi:hypothetical protein